jgi:hypothetical protein
MAVTDRFTASTMYIAVTTSAPSTTSRRAGDHDREHDVAPDPVIATTPNPVITTTPSALSRRARCDRDHEPGDHGGAPGSRSVRDPLTM